LSPQNPTDVPSQKIQDLKETIRNNEKRLTEFQQRIADLKALVEGRPDRIQDLPAESYSQNRSTPQMNQREQR
jgi:cell division protein FtsL